jgi:phosphomethylpyrimidine synthase
MSIKNGICPSTLDVTRGPLSGSQKIYMGDLQVPMRQIVLSNGQTQIVYDPSGPFTDDQIALDIMRGISPIRRDWIGQRGNIEECSPLYPPASGGGREA